MATSVHTTSFCWKGRVVGVAADTEKPHVEKTEAIAGRVTLAGPEGAGPVEVGGWERCLVLATSMALLGREGEYIAGEGSSG